MEYKKSSSGSIKTFAKIIFVIGIIFTILLTIALIAGSIIGASDLDKPAIAVCGIIGSLILCAIMVFLLVVEKAFLMTYAEMGEDMREVRNILAKRDEARS